MDSKELYAIYEQHPAITTDSRECPEGSIFIALKGESFDGNQFAAQALDKGCAVAIVDDEQVGSVVHGKCCTVATVEHLVVGSASRVEGDVAIVVNKHE